MVHNKEMREVQEYLEAELEDSGLYREIDIGGKVEGVDNTQKKRHVYAERFDGEEFLYVVNSDTMVDRDFRNKVRSASEEGIYTMPVFYRNTTSQGDREFFRWFRGKFRESMEHLPEHVQKNALKTTKNERTALELMDDSIVYFDRKGELQVYGMDFSVEASYHHRDDFSKNEARLRTAALPEKKYSTEHFVNGRKESGVLYSLPIKLDAVYENLEKAEKIADKGEREVAEKMLSEAEKTFDRKEFPEGVKPYTERFERVKKLLETGPEQMSLFSL